MPPPPRLDSSVSAHETQRPPRERLFSFQRIYIGSGDRDQGDLTDTYRVQGTGSRCEGHAVRGGLLVG
jgi:hypothetical protein